MGLNIKVKNSGFIKLQKIRDREGDGTLYIAEALKSIPFEIKRSYVIKNPERSKAVRGMHAHKKFYQVIICLNGSFTLALDDGKTKQKLVMKDPSIGVILGPRLWHSMFNLSDDCIIHVLSDSHYDESDYIRDYDDFLKHLKRIPNEVALPGLLAREVINN